MTLARRLLLAFIFCCVFLAGLIAFAPASLMGYALERASGGKLVLALTDGSLWHGSGVALLRQNNRQLTLGSYRWDLRLFDGMLQVRSGQSAPMTIRYAPLSSRIAIEALQLALPASALEVLAPQLGPYQLHGTLAIHGNRLELDASGLRGQIDVDWKDAASGLTTIRPLGDYRIALQGSGTAADARISTLTGKLLLAGSARYDQANGLQLDGTAQAAPGAAATELNELLHHIGPEVSPGVFTLALMPQPAAH